jgi:hypothetical protein
MAVRPPVLVGFADALAGIESAWCLADDGFEVHAFARHGSRPPVAGSRRVRIIEVTSPEDDAHQCAAEVAAAARQLGTVAVLPLDDHAVWLCDRAAALDTRVTVAGPTGRLATLALDKRLQLNMARSAGLAVPPGLGRPAQLPGPGPWMVKPALAVQLRDGRLHRDRGQIAARPEQVPVITAGIGGPVIVQRLIAGVGEGVFGLGIRGTATVPSGHRRIRMMNPRGSGSSACRSMPVASDVAGPVADMIGQCGWDGLFMIELLRDDAGQPWFMELNGRAWGSMALARHRGYRYPSWAVQAALDPRFRPAEPAAPPEVTARHLGREIVHLGTVLARGGAPRLAAVRGVVAMRRGERWYNYRAGEIGVFAADTWATVRAQAASGISRVMPAIGRKPR